MQYELAVAPGHVREVRILIHVEDGVKVGAMPHRLAQPPRALRASVRAKSCLADQCERQHAGQCVRLHRKQPRHESDLMWRWLRVVDVLPYCACM